MTRPTLPRCFSRNPAARKRCWAVGMAVGLSLGGISGHAVPLAQAQTKPATSQAADSQPSTAEIIPSQIVNVVGQHDPEVRHQAALTICRTQSKEGVAALVSVLTSQNNQAAKLAVCEAITETHLQAPELIDPLKNLLDAQNSDLQQAAAAALGIYTDEHVTQALAAYQQRREHDLMAQAVRDLMDRLYQATAEQPKRDALLLDWLQSPLALQRLKALNLLHDALRSTGTQPPPEVLAQIRTMTSDPDEQARAKVVAFLRDLGMLEDAPRIAAMATGEEPPIVRQEIYKALGKLADPETIPVCMKGLGDPDPQVAGAAAEALGQLCETGNGQPDTKTITRAVDALIQRYENPELDPTLRRSLIEAMANIANPKVAPILVKHAGADEPDPAIRQAAIRGLGRLADPTHLNIVLDRLTNDPDAGVRETATKTVGLLGNDPAQLAALRTRLDRSIEPSPAVTGQAWEAYQSIFQRLGPTEQEKALQSWETTFPDRMILLAAKVKPEIRNNVAAFLLQYVTKLNQSDHAAALAFVQNLTKTIPDRFGPEWAGRFEAASQASQPASQPASTEPAAS